MAQLMLSRKWIGNWWVWIAADVIYIGLYASKGLWLTSVLYVVFLTLCVVGLRQWRTAQREAAERVATEQAAENTTAQKTAGLEPLPGPVEVARR